MDALNRIINETYGNGLISQRQYAAGTGDLNFIQTGTTASPTAVQNETYGFDELGNVTARSWWDGASIQTETFGYDPLNRLTTVTGPANKTYAYAPNGNLTAKTDVGTYAYPTNGTRPHAVSSIAATVNTGFTYDPNGNLTTGNGRTLTYTSFNKPTTISQGGGTTTLAYDAGFNRLLKADSSGTTVYIGKLYERITSGTTTTQKHYLYAGPHLVGVNNVVNGGSPTISYFHTDHLGSVDTIADETGGVVQRLSYDAWGQRRNPDGTDATSITALTPRGYTRHEHDEKVSLINMNAREYDPLLGRFLTPDTIVQFPYSSQGLNRYAYVHNNPLSFTDPSGQGLGKKLRKAVQRVAKWGERVIEKAKDSQAVRTVVAVVAAYYTFNWVDNWATWAAIDSGATTTAAIATGNVVGGAASGFVAGGIAGGNLKSAFYGGVTGGIFGGVSSYTRNWNDFGRISARGFTGGVTADWQGGDFRTGFIYSGTSATASWGYQKFVGYMTDPRAGEGIAPRGPDDPPPPLVNTIGTQVEPLKPGMWDYLFSAKEGSLLSQTLNLVPGINAVSKFHDNIIIRFEQDTLMRDWVMNVPTMPMAAMITYGALLDGPLATQLAVDRSR